MNLWFNNAVDQLASTLGNYWQNSDCTVPAASLPDWSVDTVHVLAEMHVESSISVTGTIDLQASPVQISEYARLAILAGGTFSNTTSVTINVQSGSEFVCESGVNLLLGSSVFVVLAASASLTVFGIATSGVDQLAAAVFPTESTVRTGIPYGPTGTDYIGTCAVPGANDVRTGVQTGSSLGRIIVPAAADVRDGVYAGYRYYKAFPAPAGYVTEVTGVLDLPAEEHVKDGVKYDSETKTGTYEGEGGGGSYPIIGGSIILGSRG